MEEGVQTHELVLQVPVSGYFYSGYQGIVLGEKARLLAIDRMRYMVELICLGLYAALGVICLSLFLQKTSERYILLLVVFTAVTAYRFMSYSEHLSRLLRETGRPDIYRLFFFLRYVLCRVFVPAEKRGLSDKLMALLAFAGTGVFILFPEGFVTGVDKLNLAAMLLEGVLIVRGLRAERQGARILLVGWGIYTGMELFYRALRGGWIAQGIVDVLIRPTQYAHVVYLLAFSGAILGKFAAKFKEAESMKVQLEQKVSEQTSELRKKNMRILEEQERRQRFLTDIMHNLRNPLFALGGYVELLEDQMPEQTPQQRTYIELINGKLAYVNRLVADMLLADRLENGRIEFHCVALAFPAFLERIVSENKLLEHVDVHMSCPEMQVYGDGLRLHQAIDNVLDNAALHGNCTRLDIEVVRERDTVSMVFSDNGAGMSAEMLAHAFERYRSGGGKNSAGLGLSIALEIVRRHGGTLELQSEPGAGTAAKICLPDAAPLQKQT